MNYNNHQLERGEEYLNEYLHPVKNSILLAKTAEEIERILKTKGLPIHICFIPVEGKPYTTLSTDEQVKALSNFLFQYVTRRSSISR